MTENMKKYLEMISQDEEFRKEMDKLEEEHIQAQKKKIMEHAASKGITLTEGISLTEEVSFYGTTEAAPYSTSIGTGYSPRSGQRAAGCQGRLPHRKMPGTSRCK